MGKHKYTAAFSAGDSVIRNTSASRGKACAVIEDGTIVASSFAVRAKALAREGSRHAEGSFNGP